MKVHLKGAIRDSRAKRVILENLRNGPVSGEELGKLLGLSRVAIWKHVRELNSLGYSIKATRRGYRLVREAKIPYPWELGVKSLYFRSVPSTMNVTKALAEEETFGTFVIAGEQTAGRGRLGRSWVSMQGGLYFSVGVSQRIPMEGLSRLRVEVMESIVKVLENLGVKAEAAENGIFTENGKLGGVLVEGFGEPELVRFALVGVGINVNNPVPEEGTSLSIELGKRVSLLKVARAVIEGVDYDTR
ncbi:biotin--[acetyl-CoA-carboxylase] ligase [Thermococcus sp.]|uniref:biotin--[acetyl-CoA-carboxylase] ligase n=1 Tax=Thermococcus sp. TaxID=35749 RepID=UPI0026357A94|nr:biotin--[acetyl-CoA-carboxylase] ligase [Thermococcus sp.]